MTAFHDWKDKHNKYSVSGSSPSWKDLVVDLLRGMGVQLAGREIQQASSVLNHGG